MKNIIVAFSRNSLLAVFVVVMLFTLTSCARKISFQTSSVVPAANGMVKVKMNNNNNYGIKISLANLAAPNPGYSLQKILMYYGCKRITTALKI